MALWHGSGESFIWGLNSNPSCKNSTSGIIRYLKLYRVYHFCLNACPEKILHGITTLDIISSLQLLDHLLDILVQVIPVMANLNTLSIGPPSDSQMDIELLKILARSNITCLKLQCNLAVLGFLGSLANLITPKSGKLKELSMIFLEACDVKPLCETIFGSSSLHHLTLVTTNSVDVLEGCYSLLETNTCLTSLSLVGYIPHALQTFSKILRSNSTLQKIYLDIGEPRSPISKLFDLEQVEKFNAALATNTTLKEFTLRIKSIQAAQKHKLTSLIHDSRVKLC